eukprot:10424545-Prorocentrum_lima.AAC.1
MQGPAVMHRCAEARHVVYALRSIGRWNGVTRKARTMLSRATVMPRWLYGCEAWGQFTPCRAARLRTVHFL